MTGPGRLTTVADSLPARARTGPTPTSPILGVQYLRGIACVAVIVFHVYGGSTGDFYVGQAGVDLFFLISGFIMWTVTTRREQAPGQFLLRRLIRVVPLYWGITLLLFARRYVLGTATLPDLVYSLLFIPHVMSDGSLDPIIGPGWTLNFEMFFYLVFALALWVSVSHRLAAATLLLVGLVAVGWVAEPRTPILAAYTNPVLLEFLAGAGIGFAVSRLRVRLELVGWVALLLGLAALAWQQAADLRLVDMRVLAFGPPCAAILGGMLLLERSMPHVGALKQLGDASYAIYLVHVPVMSLLNKVAMPLTVRALANVGLSIAVGALFHAADRRVNRWLNRRPTSASRT